MSRGEIRGAQYPVRKVFSDEFAFTIPPYQRPYAWTTEQAGELLDDLLAFLGEGTEPIDDLSPYFLGSIVLVQGDAPEAEIVDGQQRLTTLTILLAALRASLAPQYAEGLTPFLYERANLITGAPDRYRLSTRDRDAHFLQEYIQREGGLARLASLHSGGLSDSQQNMLENALLYLRQLQALPDARRLRLAQFVVTRCLLVVVATPDLDSAYRIFSVLNNRGLDLSHTDILKAEIIGALPTALLDQYVAKWEDLEESLGRRTFEDLFGYIRMIQRKGKARDSILKEFREYVMGPQLDARHLIDEVLVPYGEALHIIKNAGYLHAQHSNAVNAALDWLNRIDFSDWLPAALVIYRRYHRSPEQLARLLADLERLAAGMMMLRAGVASRAARFAKVLAALDQPREHYPELLTPDSPLQLQPLEQRNILNIISGNLDTHNTHARKYILLRLESDLAGARVTTPLNAVTVEHVLPQNPPRGSEWERWFPQSTERARSTHLLGNLVLLTRARNTAAANYDFERKKRAYLAGEHGAAIFALAAQVAREPEWTPAVVTRRQHELVGRLRAIWRL